MPAGATLLRRREIAQSFVDAGAVAVRTGGPGWCPAPTTRLPGSTALLRRLALGTGVDVELAKVVAAFGRFSLRHLGLAERLTGLSPDGVAQSFDRLVGRDCWPRGGGGYEFSHTIRATGCTTTSGLRSGGASTPRSRPTSPPNGARASSSTCSSWPRTWPRRPSPATPPPPRCCSMPRILGASAPLVAADYFRRAAGLLPVDSPAPRARRPGPGAARGRPPREAAAVGAEALAALSGGPRATPLRRSWSTTCTWGSARRRHRDRRRRATWRQRLPAAGDPYQPGPPGGRYGEAAATFADAVAALDGAWVTPAAKLMALSHLVQYANHVGEVGVATDLLRRVEALPAEASPVSLAAHELVAYADWRPGLVARIEEHLEATALRPDGAPGSIGGSSETARVRVLWMRGRWDEALAQIGTTAFDLEQRGTVASAFWPAWPARSR